MQNFPLILSLNVFRKTFFVGENDLHQNDT